MRLSAALICLALIGPARAHGTSAIPMPLTGSWGSHGSGPGQFDGPGDIGVAPSGNLYVVDFFNGRIQYFTPSGGYLGQWGTLGTDVGEFQTPDRLGFDRDGNVYVTDPALHRLQKFTATGQHLATFSGDSIPAPLGVGVDDDGIIFVGNPAFVSRLDAAGHFQQSFSTYGGRAIEVDTDVFVVNASVMRLEKFDRGGDLLATWAARGGFPEDHLTDIATDDYGHVLVGYYLAGISFVRLFSRDLVEGDFLVPTLPGPPSLYIGGIAVGAGALYVADQDNDRILRYEYLSVPTTATSWGRLKALYR